MYPFGKKITLSGFKIVGTFKGLPFFKDIKKQGSKGHDDFPLRIGFIIPGDKKMTGIKRFFAADWVKRLYEQVPAGTGLEKVLFFDVTQDPDQVGKMRIHPSSDLIQEYFFAFVSGVGPFIYEFKFKEPIESVATWISIDGDDTNSTFDVLISQIEFQIK